MARLGEEEMSEWEICEVPLGAAAPPPATPQPNLPGEPEDQFELVDRVSTGGLSCDSDREDEGAETAGQHHSDDENLEDGGSREPSRTTSESAPEDEVAAAVPVAQSDHEAVSDGGSTRAGDEPRPTRAGEDPATRPFMCRGKGEGRCETVIFKARDINSEQYHAHSSPGYLLDRCEIKSIKIDDKSENVSYATGHYKIKNVYCTQCGQQLGITYFDVGGTYEMKESNRWKLDKFLVGIDRLILPKGVGHPLDPNNIYGAQTC